MKTSRKLTKIISLGIFLILSLAITSSLPAARAATSPNALFSDDFNGAGPPDASRWTYVGDTSIGITLGGGYLNIGGFDDSHKRINSIPTFSPSQGGGIRARALIRLTGDFQKFGFSPDPSDSRGGFFFDTFDDRYPNQVNYVRVIAWSGISDGGSQADLIDTAIPATWGTFHDFAINWTTSKVVFLIDNQEVAHVDHAFTQAVPIGIWNDRDSTMLTDEVEVTGGNPFSITADSDHVWANGHQETKLTVREIDASGQGVSGHQIQLNADPASGVTIKPVSNGSTDGNGEATFIATSTEIALVEFTATDANLSTSTTVEFQRRKIVVQFLGITTNLQCNVQTGQCIPNIPRDPWDNTFETIRTTLINSYHFKNDDFLWYSYNGGSVDHASGKWQPKGYECQDTAQAYDISIFQLRLLINQFGNNNPNTDFYLVGHSQGGLIAFQELGFLNERPAQTSIGAIITLDSPLGGMPKFRVKAKQWTDCWDHGRAPDQLVQLYNYQVHRQDHDQQGTNARILCSLHGIDLCSDQTNGQAVQLAPTYTFGSSDDAVYTCFSSTASTQVVNGAAGGGIFPLGGGLFGQCSKQSHSMPFTLLAGVVSGEIGNQIGTP
jgi:hypothetical protein